ncbi:protein still life, isoform SIF type 1 [Caerostris extrusa]|uniref:Protein still life, isoform SIF type 1 n=1 Tax=Caerostris extrusa TaxID=172846 RepID=A0AAV4R7X6_CAEEX|nr:protein still life, isoform SIF type 1 [Caerostris extrusa]
MDNCEDRIVQALKGMERVAEHINEMQRIHEEYGAIFDHLSRQHYKSSRQHVDLSPGELLYYGGAAVVFLCKERIRQKKKLMGGSSKTGSAEVEIIRYQVLIPVTEVQVKGRLREGRRLPLPLGAHPPPFPNPEEVREDLPAIQQHERVPECLPAHHPADHPRERAQHDSACEQAHP